MLLNLQQCSGQNARKAHLKGLDEATGLTARPTSTASSISAFSDISAPAEPVAENGNRSDPVTVRAASASIAPTLDSTQGPTSDEGSSSEEEGEEDSASVREARRLPKGKYLAIGTPPGSPIRRFGPNPAATRATRTQIGQADAHIPVRPLTGVPEAAEVQTVLELSAVIDKAAEFQERGLIPDVVVPESEDERDELLPTDDDNAADNDNVSHVSDSEDERAELRWGVIRPGREDIGHATQNAMAVDKHNTTNLLARLDDALALNGAPASSPNETELFGPPQQPHTPLASPRKLRYGEATLRRLQESEAHREELRRHKYEAAKAERTRIDAYRLDTLASGLASAFGVTGSADDSETLVDIAALLAEASPHPPSREDSPAAPFTRSGAPSPASSQPTVELSPPPAVDQDAPSARLSPVSPSPDGPSQAPRWPLPQRKRPREAQEQSSAPPSAVAAEVQTVPRRPRIPLPSRRKTLGVQPEGCDAAKSVEHAGFSREAPSAATPVVEQLQEREVGCAAEPFAKRAKVEKIVAGAVVKAEGLKKDKAKTEKVKKEKTKKARDGQAARVAHASVVLTHASSSHKPLAHTIPAVRIHRGPLLTWVIEWVTQLERVVSLLESKKTANDLPDHLLLVLATVSAHVNHPDFTVHTKDGFMVMQCKKLVALLRKLGENDFWEEHVQRPEAWGAHRQRVSALLRLLRRTWFPRK